MDNRRTNRHLNVRQHLPEVPSLEEGRHDVAKGPPVLDRDCCSRRDRIRVCGDAIGGDARGSRAGPVERNSGRAVGGRSQKLCELADPASMV